MSKNTIDLGGLIEIVGIAVLTLMLGPIDLGRTVYSTVTGDTPVLKEQLLDYSRRNMQRKNPSLTSREVESRLAINLDYNLKNSSDTINPQRVGIGRLWDESENNARNFYERWVWPSID